MAKSATRERQSVAPASGRPHSERVPKQLGQTGAIELASSELAVVLDAIGPIDSETADAARRALDNKTKPRGSLGQLEQLAIQLAAIRASGRPLARRKALVVMAADHGVAAQGVSAYPQEVTAQMLANFAAGGAAINVLSRNSAAELVVVDMGVCEPVPSMSRVRSVRVGAGTSDFTQVPAMSSEQAARCLQVGIALAYELADQGVELIGLGEMGIANTTSASALIAAYTGASAADVTGTGTGIGRQRLAHKRAVVERGLALHAPDARARVDPLRLLARLGGFEIAGLVGVTLGAAVRRMPVLVDGLITSAAALAAVRLSAHVQGYLIASHRSTEPGHVRALQALGLRPLLDLGLRLGEGTGAALAMHLVDAALAVLHDMASFASAGVTDTGH